MLAALACARSCLAADGCALLNPLCGSPAALLLHGNAHQHGRSSPKVCRRQPPPDTHLQSTPCAASRCLYDCRSNSRSSSRTSCPEPAPAGCRGKRAPRTVSITVGGQAGLVCPRSGHATGPMGRCSRLSSARARGRSSKAWQRQSARSEVCRLLACHGHSQSRLYRLAPGGKEPACLSVLLCLAGRYCSIYAVASQFADRFSGAQVRIAHLFRLPSSRQQRLAVMQPLARSFSGSRGSAALLSPPHCVGNGAESHQVPCLSSSIAAAH